MSCFSAPLHHGSAVSRDHHVWSPAALDDHGTTAVASVDARDRPLPSSTTTRRTAPARSCAVGSLMLCRHRPRRRPVARIRRRGTALGAGAIPLNWGGYTSGHRQKQAESSAATPQTTSACAGSAEGRCRRADAVRVPAHTPRACWWRTASRARRPRPRPDRHRIGGVRRG
jgi:hypothetical protein